MRSDPINLLGGSNVDNNVTWSTEDTVNYFIERASSDGFLTPLELRDAPGLKPYVIGPVLDDIPAGPVRGSHDCEGKQFHVMGNTLFQVTPSGIAIPLGVVPGTQRVNMAHNQIPGGNEVIITTGTPNGYVFNTVTQVFGRITDPGYPGGGSVDYIDTYLVAVEPYGRYWYWSDQANATSYNTLNRTEAEADPDAIMALAVNAFEVVVFGQNTVEFFYNAGGINGSTFRSKKVMNNHGCAARDSVVKLDNSLFWLGVDGIIYRLNGYQAVPVSTPQFTQRIQGKNWAKAYAYAFEDQGHVAYIITFPDGETFAYDVPVQATTRLESYGLTRWRTSTLIRSGRRWVAGDFQAGKLYELDWGYPMEGEGTPMVRERISGNTSNARNKSEANLVELLFQVGSPTILPVEFIPQPEGPTVSLSLPNGNVGESWAGGTATATGGTPPYKFSTRPGTVFPGNLGPMSPSGVIASETPTEVGNGTVVVRATDKNGLFDETTANFQIAMLLPWIMSGGFTDVKDVKPSTDGIDWSDPGIDGPPASSYYRDDTEFLSVSSSVDCVWISTAPLAGTWTSLGIDLEAGVVGPSRAAKAGGNWFIASTVPNARKYDGVTTTTLSWAAWTMAVIKGTTDTLFTVNSVSGGNVVLRDEDGVQTGTAPFRVSGTGVTLCTVGSRVAILHNDAAGDPQLKSIDVAGNVLTHTCPFTGPSGILNFIICYSAGLDLIVMMRGDQVAYGPSLDEMTLAAHVLSGTARGIAEDGTRITAVGDGRMCETTLDGINWTPLTVSDTDVSTVIDAIIAISNTEDL